MLHSLLHAYGKLTIIAVAVCVAPVLARSLNLYYRLLRQPPRLGRSDSSALTLSILLPSRFTSLWSSDRFCLYRSTRAFNVAITLSSSISMATVTSKNPVIGLTSVFFTAFTRIAQFWLWHLVTSCGGLWNQSLDKCLSFQILTMEGSENKGVREQCGLKSPFSAMSLSRLSLIFR